MATINDIFTPGWSTSAPGDMKNQFGARQLDSSRTVKARATTGDLLRPAVDLKAFDQASKIEDQPERDKPLTGTDAW